MNWKSNQFNSKPNSPPSVSGTARAGILRVKHFTLHEWEYSQALSFFKTISKVCLTMCFFLSIYWVSFTTWASHHATFSLLKVHQIARTIYLNTVNLAVSSLFDFGLFSLTWTKITCGKNKQHYWCEMSSDIASFVHGTSTSMWCLYSMCICYI